MQIMYGIAQREDKEKLLKIDPLPPLWVLGIELRSLGLYGKHFYPHHPPSYLPKAIRLRAISVIFPLDNFQILYYMSTSNRLIVSPLWSYDTLDITSIASS